MVPFECNLPWFHSAQIAGLTTNAAPPAAAQRSGMEVDPEIISETAKKAAKEETKKAATAAAEAVHKAAVEAEAIDEYVDDHQDQESFQKAAQLVGAFKSVARVSDEQVKTLK